MAAGDLTVTGGELAAFLGISQRHLRRLVAANVIPKQRGAGSISGWRFDAWWATGAIGRGQRSRRGFRLKCGDSACCSTTIRNR
jgi:hypothetical protein